MIINFRQSTSDFLAKHTLFDCRKSIVEPSKATYRKKMTVQGVDWVYCCIMVILFLNSK